MINALPLQGVGVEVPDKTPGQLWLTAIMVLLGVVALAVVYRRHKFAKLPADQREHKSTLLGEIRRQTPETVRIPAHGDIETYREPVREAFERVQARVRGEADVHDPDRVTIREATAAVVGEIHAATGSRFDFVPRAARRIGTLAVLVATFGAVAVSTDALVAVLTSESTSLDLETLLDVAVSLTQAVITAPVDAVRLFPGGELLSNLVFAYGVLAATMAYEHWYLLSLALAIGAVAITALDMQVPDSIETRLYYHRETLALETVGAVAAIWTVGVIPAGIGRAIGAVGIDFAAVGAGVGFVLAALVTAFCGRVAAHSLRKRLRHAATIDWPAGPDRIVGAYLLVRYCAVGLALMIAPFVPVYAAVIIADGRLFDVLAALWVASVPTKLALVVPLLLAAGVLAYTARHAADDVQDALVESFARQSVRVAILQRGLTIAAGLLSFGLVWAFTRSLVLALLGAVVLSLLIYGAYELIDRAAYRLDLFGDRGRTRRGVLVQAYAVDDADGTRHLIAKVGTNHTVSRETLAETVDDVLTVADAARQTGGSVPATAGQQRAEDMLELGLVGGDVETELQEQIRKTFAHELRADGWVTMDTLARACRDYPEERWKGELHRYCALGVLSRNGEVVRLERDVWEATDGNAAENWWFGEVNHS
ncbi:hypothetical protein [Natrinema ejinorense]|uniref:Uncharacterized protein n=1 Tax=Natrinema ejinorense TaxID=373386 RepID=A0A2A5QPC5_9EURY|nr:hypothetical protein [Natrinema ejinorense]PCR88701.1 hypothetical protein CP557_21980 [Natrinema ejinorense]